jgi:hypothetical protein
VELVNEDTELFATEVTVTEAELKVIKAALKRHSAMCKSQDDANTADALLVQITNMQRDLGWR